MSANTLPPNEPHRRYLARCYAEARVWRKGFPPEFKATRNALGPYIRSLRECWAIERRFPSVHTAVNH